MPGSESREDIQVVEAREYLKERFEVSMEEIEGFELEKISGDFWIVPEQNISQYEYKTRGIRALRDTGKFIKPTTYFLQLIEEQISKNRVEITKGELEELADGEMIEKEADSKGYVALELEGHVIGCGLYKDEVISSRVSRGRMKELKQLI